MAYQIVRCPECGLESNFDAAVEGAGASVNSLEIRQDEMKKKCKLAKEPNFNFFCPHFNQAMTEAMTASLR